MDPLTILIAALAAGGILLIVLGLASSTPVDPGSRKALLGDPTPTALADCSRCHGADGMGRGNGAIAWDGRDASGTERSAVVAIREHSLFAPLAALAGGVDGAPPQPDVDRVVPLGEHIGADDHRFPERHLGREVPAVDHRTDELDHHARRPSCRHTSQSRGISCFMSRSVARTLTDAT